jgi:hypothetical protein
MADPKNRPEEEEDKVEAAYENISKKLESIRNGKTPHEDDEPSEGENESPKEIEDVELEEWKGPRKPDLTEKEGDDEEEEDVELRKVKLKNLNREDDEEEEEEKDLDGDEEDDEKPVIGRREAQEEKGWEPEENDPLDEEGGEDEEEEKDDSKEKEAVEQEENEEEIENVREPEEESNIRRPSESFESEVRSGFSEVEEEGVQRRQPQPDSLDDLTEDRPVRGSQDEDDYFIPSLKPTGQRGVDSGINAERESFGSSYGQRSSMDNMQGSSNDPNNFFSQHSQNQPVKRANKFHLLILVLIGIAVIGFTVYILKGGFGEIGLSGQPSPSPSPVEQSPSPTPTPTPEPDRAQYKVRILNGSGKTGLAKTVSDKLKELGYQIDKTGNATNSAFTQTIVRVKAEDESVIAQIIKDLAPEFEASGNTSLKDNDAADIEVILGAK